MGGGLISRQKALRNTWMAPYYETLSIIEGKDCVFLKLEDLDYYLKSQSHLLLQLDEGVSVHPPEINF